MTAIATHYLNMADGIATLTTDDRLRQASSMIDKSLDYSVFQAAVLQGVAMQRYCDRHAKTVIVPMTEKLMTKVVAGNAGFASQDEIC